MVPSEVVKVFIEGMAVEKREEMKKQGKPVKPLEDYVKAMAGDPMIWIQAILKYMNNKYSHDAHWYQGDD